jgi:UDP-N-acetylmuramoyl-L-alanyl-D-glutamate--2,6-diaminopimelate ligase
VVDYAHTPDAVAAALRTLRGARPGPLVVVLGAGGDRDAGKRPGMGAAAAREADVVIVTDDNPRSEDPAAIRAAVLAGARDAGPAPSARSVPAVLEIGDRRAAIAAGVAHAWAGGADGDGGASGTLLVAGRGHERGQEVAGTTHPFDDREVLAAALRAHASAGDAGDAGDGTP